MSSKKRKNVFINFLKQANTIQKVFIFIICSLYPINGIIAEITWPHGTDMLEVFIGVAMICIVGFFVFKDYK
jgi:hypothetical protein